MLFLLSGCAERGYTLTTTPSTQTAIAQISSDIRETQKPTKEALSKMKSAVKKALKGKKEKKPSLKEINLKKEQEQKHIEARIKLLEEKAAKKAAAKALQEKLIEAKKDEELHKEKEVETTQKQLNEKKAKKTLFLKKKELARLQEQERKLKIEKALQKKKLQALKRESKFKHSNKSYLTFSQPLRFKRINKIYQKFGTSEIHGHVIYLNSNGQEIFLSQTKVYLLPVGAKLNHWYKNYYLKNKNNHRASIQMRYLNESILDINRNFDFFGVPAGNYYVIIEAHYPGSLKKIYITKKVEVGKYKKVMAVFSKKL
jgi:hypothetical protein